MIAAIVFPGYVIAGLGMARWLYPRLRPLTVACPGYSYCHRRDHPRSCRRQPGWGGKYLEIDSLQQARIAALLLGLFWPAYIAIQAIRGLIIGAAWIVTAGNEDTLRPAEVAEALRKEALARENRIAELEADCERLRQEAEALK